MNKIEFLQKWYDWEVMEIFKHDSGETFIIINFQRCDDPRNINWQEELRLETNDFMKKKPEWLTETINGMYDRTNRRLTNNDHIVTV